MTLVLDGVGVSNGLGWSPDERTMYFIDTATSEIPLLPFRSGERLGGRANHSGCYRKGRRLS